MYARNFRVSNLTCKDYRINTKTLKTIAILLILFFKVFRPLALFTLCSHATKFSSLSLSVFLSFKNMWEC